MAADYDLEEWERRLLLQPVIDDIDFSYVYNKRLKTSMFYVLIQSKTT
jgi:hypothetical protein